MLERLLIVGLGSIGRRHARVAREVTPSVRIVALRHREHAADVPDGIERCVTRLEDALAFAPQAAVIASPATRHLETALPLARAGVHLLVEKPIAAASSGVSELIGVCRDRGVVLIVGYNLRFLPSLIAFQQLLHERRAGRVLSVRAEVGQFLPSWRPAVDYRQTVSARASLGGGVLLELSHEVDYLRWLFGEIAWVCSVHAKQSDLEVDVEDTAHLLLGFATESDAAAPIAAVNLDFVRHDTTRTCTVIGDAGTLRWNGIAGTVELFERGSSAWWTLVSNRDTADESYRAEWRHFLGCMGGDRPLVSGEDGLAVLRVIEAARESSTTGAVVRMSIGGATVAGR